MPDQIWKNGLPTLLLAFVGLSIGIYSHWIVQPGIQNRYRAISNENLRKLKLDDLVDLNTIALTSVDSRQLSRRQQRELFEETQLCLRRLIAWDNKNDELHYMLGRTFDALADFYLQEATENTAADQISHSRNERKKAFDVIRRVQKMNGPFAPKAGLWIARQKLKGESDIALADLELLEQSLSSLALNPSTQVQAQELVGEILVEKSLRPSIDLDSDDRLKLLREADGLLRGELPKNRRTLVWTAEAKSPFDPMSSREMAWKAAQDFWAESASEIHSPESLASAFHCLVLAGNVREAQGFLSNRIPTLSSLDQSELRKRAAAACLRSIIVNSIGPKESANQDRNVALLAMAIQLHPESHELLALFDTISSKHKKLEWSIRLCEHVMTSKDVGLKQLVSIFENIQAGVTSFDSKSFETSLPASPSNGIVASKLILKLAEKDSVPLDSLLVILRTINRAVPDLLVVWSDRASLHLKHKQYDQALECLEFLKQKLPDNTELDESIRTIRKSITSK